MYLSQAPKNKVLFIEEINCSGITTQKLMNFGIFKETQIILKGSAPLGDPLIVEVNGNLVAIRKTDAKSIIVEAAE
jgi:ferrous iron transport protein A